MVVIFLSLTCYAHQDPRGEIHPLFYINDQGGLSINFRINLGGEEPLNYVAPVTDGVIGDHQKVSKERLNELIPPKPLGVWIKHKTKTYIFGSEPLHPPQLFEVKNNSPSLIQPKWPEAKGDFYGLPRSYAVTDKHFVFLVFYSDDVMDCNNLHLYFFSRDDLSIDHHISLGEGTGVFEPTTTDLSVVDGSVYLCWSKEVKDNPPQLILSKISPDGEQESTVIEKGFHWNGGMDMTVFKNRIYVAYHLPGKKLGKSKIHIYAHK